MEKKLVGVVIVPVEVPKEFIDSTAKLKKYLKEKHDLDLLGEKVGVVLEVFQEVFRPLLNEYQNGHKAEADVAIKLLEYHERLTMLADLGKYALSTHKVDITEGPIARYLSGNTDKASEAIQEMLHNGKSYEDAYRYIRSAAVFYHVTEGQVH